MAYIPTGKELIDPFKILEDAGIREHAQLDVHDLDAGRSTRFRRSGHGVDRRRRATVRVRGGPAAAQGQHQTRQSRVGSGERDQGPAWRDPAPRTPHSTHRLEDFLAHREAREKSKILTGLASESIEPCSFLRKATIPPRP